MPRTPITWSSPPFSWAAEPELDEKSLNSPQPCQHGSKCTYKKEGACCAFVHPGEQGTGRVFFPARTVTADGKQIYQKAAVRLVGSSFYERRRLGLSWPEWCAKKGLSPVVQPVSSVSPVVQPVSPVQPVHNGTVISNGQIALGPQPSAQVMHLAYLFQAMQQQAYAAQQEVAKQFQDYAKQQVEAAAILAAHHKQEIGNRIFAKVTPMLETLKAQADYGSEGKEPLPEIMTAGKVTGMFLEGMGIDELQDMLKDDAHLEQRFNEAIEILHTHWETVVKSQQDLFASRWPTHIAPEGQEWVCGRWVAAGTDPLE